MQPHNNASLPSSQPTEPNWVPIDSVVTCNRCGRANLAWQQSKRTEKWYLCVTRRTRDGKLEADRRGFHKCEPAFKNAHGLEVSDHDIPF
jgi:hypothetical protein